MSQFPTFGRWTITILVAIVALCWMSPIVSNAQSGDPDPTFHVTIGGELHGSYGIFALAIQNDKKILVGGAFTNVNGVFRSGIARLNADGSLDSSFDPGSGANDWVVNIVIQPDGRIIVGGGFSTLNGGGAGVVRLLPNGALDETFTSEAGLYGYVLAYHPSGKIYVSAANFVRRLNIDGSRDTNFSVTIDSDGWFGQPAFVSDFAVQPDGRILFAGNFTYVNDELRYASARLNADGTLDASFDSDSRGFFFEVDALGLRSDGQIYQSGGRLTLLQSDGTLNTNFDNAHFGFNTFICVAAQRDDKPIVGGNVTAIVGSDRNFLARFRTNGLLEEGFSGYPDAPVRRIVIQPDGRILIGGGFNNVGGEPHKGMARLLGDNPVLETHRAHGGDIIASWPAAYTNWVLQGTKNEKFGDWETVTNTPMTLNGINYVTNRIGETGKFYRLVKPEGTNQSSLAQ